MVSNPSFNSRYVKNVMKIERGQPPESPDEVLFASAKHLARRRKKARKGGRFRM